jgi:hypothetical protein
MDVVDPLNVPDSVNIQRLHPVFATLSAQESQFDYDGVLETPNSTALDVPPGRQILLAKTLGGKYCLGRIARRIEKSFR